jgi:hypothetical protein
MSPSRISARLVVPPALVAMLFAAAPSTALGDAGIPLESAISEQYHAAVDAIDATAGSVPEAPAAVPERVIAPVAEQYQNVGSPSNSELVAQPPGGPPAPPAPTPEPVAEAPTPAVPAVPAVPDVPGPVSAPEPLPDVDAVPAADPAPKPPPAAVPAPAPAGDPPANVNISIRIFSPGDDGPVTQIASGTGSGSAPGGGSGGAPPASAPAPSSPAPTTWNWNWNWSGAGACDPGAVAPSRGVAGWTWNWTCGAVGGTALQLGSGTGALSLPDLGSLVPGVDLPPLPVVGVPDLSNDGAAAGHRTARGALARAPRHAAPSTRVAHGALAQGPRIAAATFPLAAPPNARPGGERPRAGRHSRGDIGRRGAVIPHVPDGPPVAVASSAAAATAGAAPALLETLLSLLICFAASTLLVAVGLPRLRPRAARLERPG